MLEVGTKAMHFQLYDDKHNLVSLDMFKGKKIVLYFTPKTIHLVVVVKQFILNIFMINSLNSKLC